MTTGVRATRWRDPVIASLWIAYAVLWVAFAISPSDRSDWLLENGLVFVAWAVLAWLHRRAPFSRSATAALVAFLSLHAMGAHYTYSHTPLGDWLEETLGLARNPYDRMVHGLFGLLLVLPIRERLERWLRLRRPRSSLVAWMAVVSFSASYEVIEWAAARIVDPALGVAFVGAQGDVWDAQKDMSLALSGAATTLIASGLVARIRRRRAR